MLPVSSNDKVLSTRVQNELISRANQSKNATLIGGSTDNSTGNPVTWIQPTPEAGCWAKLKKAYYPESGSPTYNYDEYWSWIEQERYEKDSGIIGWRDVEDPRGSEYVSSIKILNPGREVNNHHAEAGQIVWMYPGALKLDSNGVEDWEHLFIIPGEEGSPSVSPSKSPSFSPSLSPSASASPSQSLSESPSESPSTSAEKCWVGILDGVPFHKTPDCEANEEASCESYYRVQYSCGSVFDDAGHLVGGFNGSNVWSSPWDIADPTA